MTQTIAPSFRDVIFLDTNAVHYAKLALSFCCAKGIDTSTAQWDFVKAELAKVPYMVVVGEREAAARQVSLRLLRGSKGQTLELAGLIDLLKAEPIPA